MIVKRTRDDTFIIVGLTYAALEDLVSAYDSLSFYYPPDDLYDVQDQIEPLRQALRVMPALTESDDNRDQTVTFDPDQPAA